jgi:hypothetical protein
MSSHVYPALALTLAGSLVLVFGGRTSTSLLRDVLAVRVVEHVVGRYQYSKS